MKNSALVLVGLLALGGCGSASVGPGGVSATAELPPAPSIDGPSAQAAVAAGAVLLDVTPNARASESVIEGRTHIPMDELEDRMGELDQTTPVIVYCLNGGASPRAGSMLLAAGYNVQVLGAMANWGTDIAAEGAAAATGAVDGATDAAQGAVDGAAAVGTDAVNAGQDAAAEGASGSVGPVSGSISAE